MQGGAKNPTKLVSEEGWTSEFTPKSTSGKAMAEMTHLTERLNNLMSLQETLQSQEQLIVEQLSDLKKLQIDASVVLKSIDKYGQLLKRYINTFKAVLEQAKNAQRITHEILLQLRGRPNRSDVRIEKHAKIVQSIYENISSILADLENVSDKQQMMNQKLQSFRTLFDQHKVPLETLMAQGQELQRQASEAIKTGETQLKEIPPSAVREQIKQHIEQKKEEIKTFKRALGVCRKMKKLQIDSSATSCRPRSKGSRRLFPCPSNSMWCNYCLTNEEACFAPKLIRSKGQYQMKPRVNGAKTQMFADGICQQQYTSVHQPCPINSKLKHYCVRDTSQCNETIRTQGKGNYSRKVPRV
jgi:hypothetical protein